MEQNRPILIQQKSYCKKTFQDKKNCIRKSSKIITNGNHYYAPLQLLQQLLLPLASVSVLPP